MDTKPFFPIGMSRRGSDLVSRVPRLLILDFDGTLAPIAPTPETAKMQGYLRRLLLRLSRSDHTDLAILSGRSLLDLKRKTRLPGVLLVGNHGLTFSRSDINWPKSDKKAWYRATKDAIYILQPLVDRWKGARIETKRFDLSLHFRQANLGDTVRFIPEAIHLVRHLPLAVRHGKCVLDFRPRRAPGKGEALERLASRLSPGWRKSGFCVYIGDDYTDEDAFRVIKHLGRNTLALRVGPGPSRAHYHLRDTHEVLRFLELFREDR